MVNSLTKYNISIQRNSSQKEENTDTCNNTDEPQKHHTKKMLAERSQMQMTTYCMIPFIQNLQKRQLYRD